MPRPAPPAEPIATLAMVEDPELWRQVGTVASLYARHHPWLRDEFASACNLAVARSYRNWRPDGGATLRSLCTFSAHRACRRVLAEARPLGFRSGRAGYPSTVPLDDPLDDDGRPLTPLDALADPGPAPDPEAAELAAMALEAAGADAEFVRLHHAEGLTLEEVGARLGVCRERARQRIKRGAERAREALGVESAESAHVSV